MNKQRIEEARAKRSLSSVIGLTVKLRRVGRALQGLCPFHKERTPSFNVDDSRGTFKCFGCGAWGDVFDFIMLTKGVPFIEAAEFLLGESLKAGAPAPIKMGHDERDEDEARRIHHAHELWLKRLLIERTLAERYLCETRGIGGFVYEKLGYVHEAYCSVLKSPMPALIAPLQDRNGHVTAIQQIFLEPETGDACRDGQGKRIKRTVGVMRDGCVRLATPQATMGLAGSVEDALSASALFSLPVWATCGEARLATVWVPPDVERLIIFADADAAGARFAADAVKRQAREWRAVEPMPPEMEKDWAQVMEGKNGRLHSVE